MARGGKREGAGRKTGIPNKITTELKEMIRNALDAQGGQSWLEKQMQENPTAFMTLLGKTIPSEVNAKIKGSATLIVRLSGGAS